MEQADSLYNGTAVSMDKTIPVTLRLNTEIIDILYYPTSINGPIDGRCEMDDARWEMGDGRWEMGDGRSEYQIVSNLISTHNDVI
jgi:hypothetical protein